MDRRVDHRMDHRMGHLRAILLCHPMDLQDHHMDLQDHLGHKDHLAQAMVIHTTPWANDGSRRRPGLLVKE